MAPNLRQVNLLNTDALINVRALKGVISATTPSPEDTSWYWDWPAPDEPICAETNLFSASHLEANLLKDAAMALEANVPLTIVAEHDDYWAEASSSSTAAAPVYAPLHHATTVASVRDADSYWAEAVHEMSPCESYWAETTPEQSYRNAHHPDYWNEATYNYSKAKDAYWDMSPRHPVGSLAEYWQEATYSLSGSDRYWATTTL